jgi:hypothetical protein
MILKPEVRFGHVSLFIIDLCFRNFELVLGAGGGGIKALNCWPRRIGWL